MNRLFALGLLATWLSGCASLEASSAWKDRPVGELIDFFGVPRQVMVVPEEDLVVLRYVRDRSYVTREAAALTRGRRTGRLCIRNTGKTCSTQAAVRSMCSSTGLDWCRRYARKIDSGGHLP